MDQRIKIGEHNFGVDHILLIRRIHTCVQVCLSYKTVNVICVNDADAINKIKQLAKLLLPLNFQTAPDIIIKCSRFHHVEHDKDKFVKLYFMYGMSDMAFTFEEPLIVKHIITMFDLLLIKEVKHTNYKVESVHDVETKTHVRYQGTHTPQTTHNNETNNVDETDDEATEIDDTEEQPIKKRKRLPTQQQQREITFWAKFKKAQEYEAKYPDKVVPIHENKQYNEIGGFIANQYNIRHKLSPDRLAALQTLRSWQQKINNAHRLTKPKTAKPKTMSIKRASSKGYTFSEFQLYVEMVKKYENENPNNILFYNRKCPLSVWVNYQYRQKHNFSAERLVLIQSTRTWQYYESRSNIDKTALITENKQHN